ncbi:hypothetical protein VTN00DRAFT_324 [Thermoascus crustaceus]|uniref:uncharacterized protein n=1 Tax=Thermoascus crustaceus TaxID=5088 RepID=UPI003742D1F8
MRHGPRLRPGVNESHDLLRLALSESRALAARRGPKARRGTRRYHGRRGRKQQKRGTHRYRGRQEAWLGPSNVHRPTKIPRLMAVA